MGLDVSHDCWSGGYTGFNHWRNILTELAGFTVIWPPGWYDDAELVSNNFDFRVAYPLVLIDWGHLETEDHLRGEWEETPYDPMIVLIVHYDSDGIIAPQQADPLADRLEGLLPLMTEEVLAHYHWRYPLVDRTKQFIKGLREAVHNGETVTFG